MKQKKNLPFFASRNCNNIMAYLAIRRKYMYAYYVVGSCYIIIMISNMVLKNDPFKNFLPPSCQIGWQKDPLKIKDEK